MTASAPQGEPTPDHVRIAKQEVEAWRAVVRRPCLRERSGTSGSATGERHSLPRCPATWADPITPSKQTRCMEDEGHPSFHRHLNAERSIQWRNEAFPASTPWDREAGAT